MDLKTEKSFALTNQTGVVYNVISWTPDEKLLIQSSNDSKALFAIDLNGNITKVIQLPGIPPNEKFTR
jgi:uncharacterized protein YjiK